MKVLVFGAYGQIGQELQRFENVIALDRSTADLTDPKCCEDLIASTQADAIINAAAYTAVDKAEEDEELAGLINGTAPGAMARAAAARDIPFLHISTDYVFEGTGNVPYKPTDATRPLNAYARTKLAGEQAVRAAGGRHVILRTSWVFSAHGTNFVKTMLRLSETRDTLSVVDDQVGGPTPAADIAAALMQISSRITASDLAGGTYHFAGAPDVSWAAFAREIFSQAGRDVTVIGIPASDYPTPAKRPLNSRLDASDLQNDFGITPPDWRRGLVSVLRNCKA